MVWLSTRRLLALVRVEWTAFRLTTYKRKKSVFDARQRTTCLFDRRKRAYFELQYLDSWMALESFALRQRMRMKPQTWQVLTVRQKVRKSSFLYTKKRQTHRLVALQTSRQAQHKLWMMTTALRQKERELQMLRYKKESRRRRYRMSLEWDTQCWTKRKKPQFFTKKASTETLEPLQSRTVDRRPSTYTQYTRLRVMKERKVKQINKQSA